MCLSLLFTLASLLYTSLTHIQYATLYYMCRANLVEFADLLIRHGVVNAVNLDGGGSSTLIENNVLINYPSDHW